MAGASTIKGSKTHMEDADSDRKSRKISDDSGFYIIDDLDSFLTDTRILAFVRKRYSSKQSRFIDRSSKYNLVAAETILEHLSVSNARR